MSDIVPISTQDITNTIQEITRLETEVKTHLGNDNWQAFNQRLTKDVGIFGGITSTDHTSITKQVARLHHILDAIREFDYPEIVARERAATPGDGRGRDGVAGNR